MTTGQGDQYRAIASGRAWDERGGNWNEGQKAVSWFKTCAEAIGWRLTAGVAARLRPRRSEVPRG
jgi:hypothetical protein